MELALNHEALAQVFDIILSSIEGMIAKPHVYWIIVYAYQITGKPENKIQYFLLNERSEVYAWKALAALGNFQILNSRQVSCVNIPGISFRTYG